jgi:hypothetical protein
MIGKVGSPRVSGIQLAPPFVLFQTPKLVPA